MKSLLLLPLMALWAQAAPPAAPSGIVYFSLCGNYLPERQELSVNGVEPVRLEGENLPQSPGFYCARGEELLRGEGWTLHVKWVGPEPRKIQFPAMVCAHMEGKSFYTQWDEDRLYFRGPFPSQPAFGWCADAKELPYQDKSGRWWFGSKQFRPMPDPDKRSGMSIGNQ